MEIKWRLISEDWQVKRWGSGLQWGREQKGAQQPTPYSQADSQSVTWSATTLYKASGSLRTAFWRKKLNMSLGPGKKQTGWCIESYSMTRPNVSVCSTAWGWTVCGDRAVWKEGDFVFTLPGKLWREYSVQGNRHFYYQRNKAELSSVKAPCSVPAEKKGSEKSHTL